MKLENIIFFIFLKKKINKIKTVVNVEKEN